MSARGIWITKLPGGPRGRRLAVKDLFDTAGVLTTYGSAVFAEHVPTRTAAAVRALEEAGWVNEGKANLHEFAYGITSQNPHYGDVPNPRFEGYVAGGSSGGSAAAVAAGEADLGLGTDSGGSIRIPAACCELAGFKPSFGMVELEGCFPLAPSFDHAGPLAADVAGCADAMRTLAGVEPATLDALGDVRAGVAWLDRADADVAAVVGAAAGLFPQRRPLELPLPDGVTPVFQREIADVHRDLFAGQAALYGPNVRSKIEAALAVSDAEYETAQAARESYRQRFAAALSEADVVIAPTMPIVPPPASVDDLEVRGQMTRLTFPLNAVGAPALALPAGRTSQGLPASVQVFGPPGADGRVLAVGALLEAALRHTAPSREELEERGA